MAQFISLCDQHGQVIGSAEKLYAHQVNQLHLAFSIMLYRKTNKGLEVLLQQRSLKKYHAPGLWANTCCSHPLSRAQVQSQAHGRLQFELGLSLAQNSLEIVDEFIYQESIDLELTEHEYDFLLIAPYNEKKLPPVNPDEVAQVSWVEWENLMKQDLADSQYAPWLKHVVQALKPAFDKLK